MILTLFWMIFESIETALLYFCAQNLGAGRSDRIRQGTRNVLVIQLGIGLACFLIAVFGGKYVHMCFVGRDVFYRGSCGSFCMILGAVWTLLLPSVTQCRSCFHRPSVKSPKLCRTVLETSQKSA